MQIRISEMLDNASELIEENSKDGYTVDNDRIKEIVFSEIYPSYCRAAGFQRFKIYKI